MSAAVSLHVLGPARITIDGAPAPAELLWRKHLALLVYLARSPRGARTREHLIGLLWSERDEKSARHSLSEALRVFRRVLGDTRVRADVDQVALDQTAVTLDCDELATRAASSDWAGAARLAAGEFLEGLSVPEANEFENWVAGERLLWRTRSVEALTKWGEAQLAVAETAGARETALKALAQEPTAEAAARVAMRGLALDGDRAAALALFDRLAAAMRGVATEPAPETRRLAERVREARVGRRVQATPSGARPRAPLIGRSRELARLMTVWDGTRNGAAAVVVIEGEPGEGKTRLLEEFLDRARLEDATVASCRAVPSDARVPWTGVVGLLAGGLSEAPGIAGASGPALAALGALDPDFAARFSRTANTPSVEPAQALSAVVRAAADEQPVVLAFDDAQDLDAATSAALVQLIRDVSGRRVLVVICMSGGGAGPPWLDELRAQIGRGFSGDVIPVGRLDPAAIEALARWWLPQYSAEDIERVVRRVARDSAGVALLAAAMLEAVAQGFRMSPDAPAWPGQRHTLVDTLPGDLPPAVVGAVCLRYRQVAEPSATVLAAAASLGERFSAGELARATGLQPEEVDRALDRLEWDRWVTVDGRGYAFTAPIERAILLQEMVTPGQVQRYRERSAPLK